MEQPHQLRYRGPDKGKGLRYAARFLPERYGSWQTVYSRFRKWIEDGTLDNIFRVLSLEAELTELSMDVSIVKAHQHSAGAKKGGLQTKSDTAVVEPAQKSMQL